MDAEIIEILRKEQKDIERIADALEKIALCVNESEVKGVFGKVWSHPRIMVGGRITSANC